jgi:hypothetical protein
MHPIETELKRVVDIGLPRLTVLLIRSGSQICRGLSATTRLKIPTFTFHKR